MCKSVQQGELLDILPAVHKHVTEIMTGPLLIISARFYRTKGGSQKSEDGKR